MSQEPRMLLGPFELLDLTDNEVLETRVDRYERGFMIIHPRYQGAPSEKQIPVLRIHVPLASKPVGLPYWDITSKTLQAQLLPLLTYSDSDKFIYRIHKQGVRPKARFSLSRRPV